MDNYTDVYLYSNGYIMKSIFVIPAVLFFSVSYGQRQFDSIKTGRLLLSLPGYESPNHADTTILKAIETVDRNYRMIADTLYAYHSLKYTIFETVLIETDDSVFINPLLFGDRLKLTSILFNDNSLNFKVDSIAGLLAKSERRKLYRYLAANFDHFSEKKKKLTPQPVRFRYIKFPDNRIALVGIDIYGRHFLWTIDRDKDWNIVKVESLWVY